MSIKAIIIPFAVLSIIGCNNNTSSNSSNMTEEEFNRARPENMIAVDTSFKPTLELSDEIRTTPLEELIINNKGHYSKLEQYLREEWIKQKIEETKRDYRLEGKRFTKEDEQRIRRFCSRQERPRSPLEVGLGSSGLKFVPASSNLAKVYYLEDKSGFIENNRKYYYYVLTTQRYKEEEERAKDAQKEWGKYL